MSLKYYVSVILLLFISISIYSVKLYKNEKLNIQFEVDDDEYYYIKPTTEEGHSFSVAGGYKIIVEKYTIKEYYKYYLRSDSNISTESEVLKDFSTIKSIEDGVQAFKMQDKIVGYYYFIFDSESMPRNYSYNFNLLGNNGFIYCITVFYDDNLYEIGKKNKDLFESKYNTYIDQKNGKNVLYKRIFSNPEYEQITKLTKLFQRIVKTVSFIQ